MQYTNVREKKGSAFLSDLKRGVKSRVYPIGVGRIVGQIEKALSDLYGQEPPYSAEFILEGNLNGLSSEEKELISKKISIKKIKEKQMLNLKSFERKLGWINDLLGVEEIVIPMKHNKIFMVHWYRYCLTANEALRRDLNTVYRAKNMSALEKARALYKVISAMHNKKDRYVFVINAVVNRATVVCREKREKQPSMVLV